jgi:hypothetical protein
MTKRTGRHLPKLWNATDRPVSVKKYLSAQWELDPGDLESAYPYAGPVNRSFRRTNAKDRQRYLEEGGAPLVPTWCLRRDHVCNELTADLLAAAEHLGGVVHARRDAGLPGGIGAEGGVVWVELLDGGVGVVTSLVESEYTNRVSGRQRTVITGPIAFRALLEVLGFDQPLRKLAGEAKAPRHEQVVEMVRGLQHRDLSASPQP